MGIFDHTRTWTFTTSASLDDCVRTFATCLNGRGGAFLGSEWSVTTTGSGGSRRTAVAAYDGRAGVGGAIANMSARSRPEGEAAVGSQLTFTATRLGETTTCTMAMTRIAKIYFFFTADARFFRSAMHRVARQLRSLDAGLALVKA